jgi:hypothetical protein
MEVGSPTKSSVRGKEIRELNGGSDVEQKKLMFVVQFRAAATEVTP